LAQTLGIDGFKKENLACVFPEWSGARKGITSDFFMSRAIEEEAFWAGLLERWIRVPLVIQTPNAIESRFIGDLRQCTTVARASNLRC
jgi:hypothetical protein